jgi:hypothetical protein
MSVEAHLTFRFEGTIFPVAGLAQAIQSAFCLDSTLSPIVCPGLLTTLLQTQVLDFGTKRNWKDA